MMQRYRKGQTFRPPTAAESAASADAVEGFRGRPPSPQDRSPYGQTIVVKTPAGGIPARDGTTIYSEPCTRCIESPGIPGIGVLEKILMETDEEIWVFNLDPMPVLGDYYVKTNLTTSGTRYAESVAYAWHRATLTQTLVRRSTATATLEGSGDAITVLDAFLKVGETIASGTVVGVEYDPREDSWIATQTMWPFS